MSVCWKRALRRLPMDRGVGWENGSIDTFLDAAAAWATASSRSSPVSASRSNVWQRCAAILLAGKFYE
ncbi:DUF7660 family protein [Pseudomonas sp. Z3-6]|uniref:DUF7660 family protein n=1 Tax=Pseudomonas sp. Z3-6 TaxID=2817411 RepID=UPI003DA7AC71